MDIRAFIGHGAVIHTSTRIYEGVIEDVDNETIIVMNNEERYAVPWDEGMYISEKEREYMDSDIKREINKTKWKFILTYFAILLGAAGIGLAMRWLT